MGRNFFGLLLRNIRGNIPSLRQNLFRKHCTQALNAMATSKTLKDFGYEFNSEGQLRKIEADGKVGQQPFQFNVSDNHQECQKHYEEVGDAVTNFVYQLLEKQERLIKLPVPLDSNLENGTFIFVTKDYAKKDKLLVLIHGSGVVRAGQWARSLIINDNIKSGSQIPYIQKAVAQNYGVIILNSNDNYCGDNQKILHSSNPEEHAIYVWETYISQTKAKSIAIVAHSYGGVVTLALAGEVKKDFEKRVKAIAFTDSVHYFSNSKCTDFLIQHSKNWVASDKPLDTPVKTPDTDITRVSAGHTKHEMTSYNCMDSVFKFIDERLK